MTRQVRHRFLPHTEQDQRQMLSSIAVDSSEDLFASIPHEIRGRPLRIPEALSEPEIVEEMARRAAENHTQAKLFLGAGAYEHFIPSVVWQLVGRGEFATAYTPYQPEVSQGTLQAAFEFQSFICELLEMEVANSSLYDGASALGRSGSDGEPDQS